MYPKEIYDLQIDFAKRVAELKPIPLGQALLEYTAIPSALWIHMPEFPKKDPTQPLWQEYLTYIKDKVVADVTYEYILTQIEKRSKPKPKNNEIQNKPCFFIAVINGEAQIHFNNNGDAEPGPLSKERMPARLAELKEAVSKLQREHPEVRTIHGYSWLYNINAYKRLFPTEFIDSAKIDYSDFQWNVYGQFINSGWELRDDMIKIFREKMERARTFDELINAIEFPPLKVSAPIEVFSKFYE